MFYFLNPITKPNKLKAKLEKNVCIPKRQFQVSYDKRTVIKGSHLNRPFLVDLKRPFR